MRVSKALAGAAALSILAAGSAVAQPAPDAEREALAQQIYQLMGAQTLNATSGALKAMMSSMTGQAGGADVVRARAMQAALSDSLERMMPKVLQGTVQIMAQDFTTEQLRAMLAFYQSPTGQAVLQKMPQITQQSVRLSLSLVPQMMRDFETDYCGRITCTDKEQQAFAQVNARMAAQAQAAANAPVAPR